MTRPLVTATAICLALQSTSLMAATILIPTASEWASWPEYCRAKYTYMRSEVAAQFTPAISQGVITTYESALGPAWVYIHHHCMSLEYWQRANLALTPRDRKEALREAISESLFTFTRIPTQLPIYAEIATHLGTVARAQGDIDSATRYFNIARDTHPDYPGGYQGLALLREDKRDYEGARDMLLEGNKATGGNSPEIHYFLGLIYLKLKNLDEASIHAKRAYELGYPLQGLRRQLDAAGRPLT